MASWHDACMHRAFRTCMDDRFFFLGIKMHEWSIIFVNVYNTGGGGQWTGIKRQTSPFSNDGGSALIASRIHIQIIKNI